MAQRDENPEIIAKRKTANMKARRRLADKFPFEYEEFRQLLIEAGWDDSHAIMREALRRLKTLKSDDYERIYAEEKRQLGINDRTLPQRDWVALRARAVELYGQGMKMEDVAKTMEVVSVAFVQKWVNRAGISREKGRRNGD